MFSIYAHIPYCETICPYCDFNVYAVTPRPEQRYVAALIEELHRAAADGRWAGRTVQTIYFGGGTPSLFCSESFAHVLGTARSLWEGVNDAEITLEATPDSATESSLAALRAAGVNRLSLGIQSLNPQHLSRLGRTHGPAKGAAALRVARAAGFDNVNVDLIFAVPAQTASEWEADLRWVCGERPEHVSAYNLTYEERTPFFAWRAQGRLTPATDEVEELLFTRAEALLTRAGYEHYEISNYALPGRESRHNSNYWRGGDYLGIGAGAHSFAARGWGERWSNERHPERYISAVAQRGEARAFSEVLTQEQAMGEFAFLSLRQRRGLDTREFARRFKCDFVERFPHVYQLCADEMLTSTGEGFALSPRGLLLADSVFATFF